MTARAEIAYSDEEAMLAQSASDLLGKRWDFAAVRRTMATDTGFDRALHRELGALGWLGVALPAAYGGAELPVGALASLCEPMGRHLFASPFLGTTLAGQVVLHAGNAAQKSLLHTLASGEAIATVALSEPGGSYEPLALQATARKTSTGFELSGTKSFVLDAEHADFCVIAASLEGKPALFLAQASELRGRLRREVLIEKTRRSARLRLDGLLLGADALLDGGDPSAALLHAHRTGALMVAADMAGGAEGVLQLTLDYVKTRKQFGKLIGSYQALKHPLVEIMCSIEMGRSLLYRAATLIGHDEPECEAAVRMAKAQLGETYLHAADRAIQFHGAIGFTYECNAQLFYRRAQWAEHVFGDALHHRRHLANLLWPRPAAPA